MADTMTNSGERPGGVVDLGGRTVSRLGYGAMALERFAGDTDAGVRLVREAIDLGVDHLDTADFYGDSVSNAIIRAALRPGDDVVVATKVGALKNPGGPLPLRAAQRPDELRAAVDDNLRSLGVERLDLVYLRRLDVGPGIRAEGDQVVDLDDQLAALMALRDDGLVGAIGVSAVDLDGLRRSLPAGVVAVQNAYGLVARQFESMLELSAANGVAWVPFFPLGSSFEGLPKAADQPEVQAAATRLGVTSAQIGLAWLLQHAPNALLIPGTGSIAHLRENVAAADILLDESTLTTLDALWATRFAAVTDPQPRWSA
ncbi:aldo/keto reductase [Herbiconiux ginsengi]|uniref:Predicted oxidoreductase n=1 Tax=Herbiconiux ginsengi TaxID=381665 RepID=A0A1H3QRI7_9MICO|nr:aldo/keto reductase [Herbiconiux ginsengi]SDZ15299.1 Predicted oxidoreductase [Herbiconiux ginsengi]